MCRFIYYLVRTNVTPQRTQHVSYGVKEEMYPSVVSALLITLGKGLGKECHPETKAAWKWVMTSISAVCIAAAREEAGEAPLPPAELTAIVAAAVTEKQPPPAGVVSVPVAVAAVAVTAGIVALIMR